MLALQLHGSEPQKLRDQVDEERLAGVRRSLESELILQLFALDLVLSHCGFFLEHIQGVTELEEV